MRCNSARHVPQWGVKNNKKIGLSVSSLAGNILVSPSLISRVNSGVVLPSRVPILFVGISVRVVPVVTRLGNSAWVVVEYEVSSGELLTLLGSETGEFIHPSNEITITVDRLIKIDLILFISNHVIEPISWCDC